MSNRLGQGTLGIAVALVLSGCVVSDDTEESAGADTTQVQQSGQAQRPAVQPVPQAQSMEIEVDLAARTVNVYRSGQLEATHPAAVGSKEWPTPTGEWTISQVVFNPRWVPPKDESWAKDEKVAEPGAPDNPLGMAQLVYSPPNTIHGTNEPESLGKAVSHGSIRVSNEVAIELARQVMEAGGAGKDDAWIRQATQNRTQRQEVSIPNPVPIRVVERSTRSGGGVSGTTGQ